MGYKPERKHAHLLLLLRDPDLLPHILLPRPPHDLPQKTVAPSKGTGELGQVRPEKGVRPGGAEAERGGLQEKEKACVGGGKLRA